jgi:GTP cyclohydrolase I
MKKHSLNICDDTQLCNDDTPLAAITNFPSPLATDAPQWDDATKIAYIAERFQEIMVCLGLDLNDHSLAQTPTRVAKMYVKEVFSGLNPNAFPAITVVDNDFQHSQRGNVIFLKVGFNSFCEHHFVPMFGCAYIAYIPTKKIIGLSKVPRLVRYFSRRPQLQERLTAQIADALAILLETEHVAVSITAQHFCVMARGIEDDESHTTTNVLRGDFEDCDAIRDQFFESINRPRHF